MGAVALGGTAVTAADQVPDRWSRLVWQAGAVSVLAVTEDRGWSAGLLRSLEVEGYAVRVDPGGEAVHEPGCPFDVVVVDLALVQRSPSSVCRAVRARTPIPILGVSSGSVATQTVLDAYAAGVDQVASSLDRPSELVARVRALLRRHPPRIRHRSPAGLVATSDEVVGDVQVDLATSTATVAGREVRLTQWECEVLHRLVLSPGRVVRRSELAPGPAGGRGDQSLDAVVRRVRAKLEAVEGRRRIVAVRGVGFRFLAAADPGAGLVLAADSPDRPRPAS